MSSQLTELIQPTKLKIHDEIFQFTKKRIQLN